jgi:hypothetical protein
MRRGRLLSLIGLWQPAASFEGPGHSHVRTSPCQVPYGDGRTRYLNPPLVSFIVLNSKFTFAPVQLFVHKRKSRNNNALPTTWIEEEIPPKMAVYEVIKNSDDVAVNMVFPRTDVHEWTQQ